MRCPRLLIAAAWLLVPFCGPVCAQEAARQTPQADTKAPEGPFLVKPYLQLGHSPAAGSLILLWHAGDADADWEVEYRSGAERPWRKAQAASARPIAVPGVEPHWVYRAVLTGLEPGGDFSYRVRKGGEVVFSAAGRAPKGADQAYRFVAFGDGGADTPEQKAIAYRTFLAKPDFVMIPGDIVYGRGRVSEYREKFWPIYNADQASPGVGAPLLRSTLFRRRAGQPRHRDSRPGEVPRRPGLFPLLGPAAERPHR